MKYKIIVGIVSLLLLLVGYEAYQAYMFEHAYYYTMLQNTKTWWLLLGALISAALPASYLLFTKKVKLSALTLCVLGGLIVFSFIHIVNRSGAGVTAILGTPATLRFLFNIVLIYAIAIYFITGLQAIGTFITKKILHFSHNRIQEVLISFGLGLVSVIILVHFLIMLTLLHPIVTRAIMIGLGGMVYYERKDLRQTAGIIEQVLQKLSRQSLKDNPSLIVALVLLILSICYYYYGFSLAYIPFPTAWDANHAYMYYPKVWADSRGFAANVPRTIPFIWYSYITIWFSLFEPLNLWIAADTIAVQMNFLSGIFVLLFGVTLIFQVVSFFASYTKKPSLDKTASTSYAGQFLGRFFLLLWLSSGMGAFLVFVDNKTDLGVMSLTALAMLSGFIFLDMIEHKQGKQTISQKEIFSYIAVSGLFFAAAAAAKVTAMQDIILFVAILSGLWIGVLALVAVMLGAIGALAHLDQEGFQHYDLQKKGIPLFVIGALVGVANILASLKLTKAAYGLRSLMKKSTLYIKYLAVWAGVVLISLFVIKVPYAISSAIQHESARDPGVFLKRIFLIHHEQDKNAQDHKDDKQHDQHSHSTLYAQAEIDLQSIDVQSAIDQQAIAEQNATMSIAQCDAIYEETTLDQLLKGSENVGADSELNEDLGRYIWKGGSRWRAFSKPSLWSESDRQKYGSFLLGYPLLRALVWTEGCHSRNPDAKLLCDNRSSFEQNFDLAALESLLTQMSPGGVVYQQVTDVLERIKERGVTSDISRERKELIDIYQHRAWYMDENKTIFIPYKYLNPLNVIFNWSLQNLSSYYTDIGFIWVLALVLIFAGLIYAIVYRHYQLGVIQGVGIAAWILWWLLAHGIIWYAVGVVLWTIMANCTFVYYLYKDSKDQTDKIMLYVLLGIILIFACIQMLFNFLRIGTQGAAGQFVWYKTNIGQTFDVTYTPQGLFPAQNAIDYQFGADNIFDLQFGHYNKFLDQVDKRDPEKGIFIAGTYLSYFLNDWRNVSYDGLIRRAGQYVYDQDVCKTYQRLKKAKLNYLVIDPNIATVATSTNDSLFTRFYGDIDMATNTIRQYGVIAMFIKLIENGYMEFGYSNNIGVQYGLSLSDQELMQYIQKMPIPEIREYLLAVAQKDMTIVRGKMVVAKYYGQQVANNYHQLIAFILQERIATGQGITEMAHMLGKNIDDQKVLATIQKILAGPYSDQLKDEIENGLSADEKFMTLQYAQILNLIQTGQGEQALGFLQQMLQQSLSSPSQIMTFKLL